MQSVFLFDLAFRERLINFQLSPLTYQSLTRRNPTCVSEESVKNKR